MKKLMLVISMAGLPYLASAKMYVTTKLFNGGDGIEWTDEASQANEIRTLLRADPTNKGTFLHWVAVSTIGTGSVSLKFDGQNTNQACPFQNGWRCVLIPGNSGAVIGDGWERANVTADIPENGSVKVKYIEIVTDD